MNDSLKKRNKDISVMTELQLKGALYDNAEAMKENSRQFAIDRTELEGEKKELTQALSNKIKD